MKFSGQVITGSGRGRRLDIPTINLDPACAPQELHQGIYACKVFLDQSKPKWLMGALHFGPRPVFQDSLSLEVHLIDQNVEQVPRRLSIEIVERLRDVRNFASAEALKEEIARDIERSRAILSTHAR